MPSSHLHPSVSGLVRSFAYFMASGTHAELRGVEYLDLYGEFPSAIEGAYAVLLNVLEVDETGAVTNPDHAQRRAAAYVRMVCDADYTPDPPFEEWETELHALPRG